MDEFLPYLTEIRDGVSRLTNDLLAAERERAETRAELELTRRTLTRLRRAMRDQEQIVRELANRVLVLEQVRPTLPDQHTPPVAPPPPVPRSPWWARLLGLASLCAVLVVRSPR